MPTTENGDEAEFQVDPCPIQYLGPKLTCYDPARRSKPRGHADGSSEAPLRDSQHHRSQSLELRPNISGRFINPPETRSSNGERPEIGRNFVQPNHSKTRGTYMCRPQTLNHAA